MARNLLLTGVGQPEDWERSKGDPVAFMLRTVERTAAAFNRKAIDAVAHTDTVHPGIAAEPDGPKELQHKRQVG